MRRSRATLRTRWWRDFLGSIRHCYACGRPLERKYVREEKRRRHVCPGCGRVTYLNPKIVAGLIPVLPNGRIALLRRAIEPALGLWTHPAGFQEMGESVEDAAAREAREEILAEVRVTRLVGVYSYADAGVVTVVFEGRVQGGPPRAGHEALEVKIFQPDDIPWKALAFRSTVHALRDWIAMSRPRRP